MPDLRRRMFVLTTVPMLLVGTAIASGPPHLRVFKNVGCTCCDAWVTHLRAAGLRATVAERPDLVPIRRAARVPDDLAGCHTAFGDGLIVEGHVPAAAVTAFLDNPGKWRGIAVPGMPLGSPGMEVDGQKPEEYEIWTYDDAGLKQLFAKAIGTVIRPA